MKKIKTWEDVCKKLKLDPNQLPEVTGLPEDIGKHLISTYKLIQVAKALNGNWKPDWNNSDEQPDWNNSDEPKYFPWWYMQGGISLGYVCYLYSSSTVPSRLCYKSREIAEYAANTFLELYKDILN